MRKKTRKREEKINYKVPVISCCSISMLSSLFCLLSVSSLLCPLSVCYRVSLLINGVLAVVSVVRVSPLMNGLHKIVKQLRLLLVALIVTTVLPLLIVAVALLAHAVSIVVSVVVSAVRVRFDIVTI